MARWEPCLARHRLVWPEHLQLAPSYRPASLCYVRQGGELLLLERNNPPFTGRWTAPGGKIRAGEDPEAAAVRELQEETGLSVVNPRLRLILAEQGPHPIYNWLLFIFLAEHCSGTLQASDEGRVAWFSESRLPTIGMLDIDLLLARYVLTNGPAYAAQVTFDDIGRARRFRIDPVAARNAGDSCSTPLST